MLKSLFIEEKDTKVNSKEIIKVTQECLNTSKYLLKFILRLGKIKVSENQRRKMQQLIETHPSLLLFEITKNNIFHTKFLQRRLKVYVRRRLRADYDRYTVLKECPVLFMGDGRVGKTSTIRSLFSRSFRVNNESTLFLNDVDIFAINSYYYDWISLSKYQMSIQRIKNSLPSSIILEFDSKKKVETKYKLLFEEELLTRTVADEKFMENMKTDIPTFQTREVYFRVYDFGGQEIFSSVHHIFMNSNSLYFLVFNMTKLKRKDLGRMKFWCESILRNAPKAKVMLIGTYLNRYKRKNTEDADLDLLNERILSFLGNLSANMSVLENESTMFFPVENSAAKSSSQIRDIKKQVVKVVSGEVDVLKEGFLNFETLTAHILFLDSCREQSSLMTMRKFQEEAASCGFDVWEVEEMLNTFSTAGLISYFPNLDLSEEENFIFFAPSYLAQALAKFIRDPTFHELAFRIPSEKFRLYRNYVDTGKLNKELFHILLKDYSEPEKKYVLQLALETMILIPVGDNKDTFILPELLPALDGTRIRPSESSTIDLAFHVPINLSVFVITVSLVEKDKYIYESLVFKGFARFILETKKIVDVFIKDDSTVGFNLVQSNDVTWLENLVQTVSTDLRTLQFHFDLVYLNRI
eukprot:snap_masked-scaffold_24-processed-gene-1.14-mRNA-1 protein AED:1.00 eAED:1.00 QI:0/0/0/0/1/1/3/0/637